MAMGCALQGAGGCLGPWPRPVPSHWLSWLFFQPVPVFSELCYYATLKSRSISRGAQHWLGTGVCTGGGAIASNHGALPWQGDPGDPGEDGAKGARGDAGSPGLPGERVGAGSLVREASGQQDGQYSAGELGVLLCKGLWASTQDPLLSPHAPLLIVSLLQGVEGPRGPPGARVSAPFPTGG